MFSLSLETSTVAFRTVLDELLCFFIALNLTSFQYFCQESFFFSFLFAFQRKFAPKIPAKIPRNRPFSPRICLFKSREISLFFPRIIRRPDYWCQVSVILLDFVINLFCLHTVTTYFVTWLLLNWISLKREGIAKKKHCPFINPLSPGNFAKKCLLKCVKPFLGHCLATNNQNCPKRCLQVEY